MSVELNGWYWVEWRGTLEPELFREGRIQDHDGDWIYPAPTRKIGPRIPEPEEMKKAELELAKLRNRVDDLYATFIETQEERDRLQAENAKYLDMIQKMYWTAGLISDGDELESVKRLREERDRLLAEVERLRPKEKSGWRFFLGGHGFRAVRHAKPGWYFDTDNKCAHEINSKTSDCLINNQRELTVHEAYALLDGWPKGQRQFRETTGYVPVVKECLTTEATVSGVDLAAPGGDKTVRGWLCVRCGTTFAEYANGCPKCADGTAKQSLTVQPVKERVRCYLGHWGTSIVSFSDTEGMYSDVNQDGPENPNWEESHYCRSGDGNDFVPISLDDAFRRLQSVPKSLARLREIVANAKAQPKERVRCYRSKYGGVWVYGVQHDTYFCSYGGRNPAQSESITRKYGIPCTLAEARALLADKPTSLAEFDRITGRDEDYGHLARLLAIPCKEMRG